MFYENTRVPKIKQIILIFEKSSTTYPKIAQKEKEMLLFHFVFESLIDSINLNFVLSKHTSVKNQTDSIILIFKKIFDHLSKDCDRLFEKSSSSMVKRNRFQSISRDFAWDGGEGLCIARRGTRRNRKWPDTAVSTKLIRDRSRGI